MDELGSVLGDNKVLVYGIRRLARTGYVYVGSTVQSLEVRMRRHLTDALRKRHVNKRLAHVIRQSNFFVIADVLVVCELHERGQVEHNIIMELHGQGHRLTNQTDPQNPRQRLPFVK